MITVDGERIWVPNRKEDLIAALKRIGISMDAGVPLRELSTKQLVRVYCREMGRVVRRQQVRNREATTSEAQGSSTCIQLPLFPVLKTAS